MLNPVRSLPFHRILRLAALVCFGLGAATAVPAASADTPDATIKSFNVPAADAPVSLKQFAQQAGLELLYSARDVAGAKTNAVKGLLTPREALTKMLSGTKLIATPGKNRGAIAVTRAPDPNG
jgi:hypothetical protein